MKKILVLGAVSMALAACSSGGDADKDGDGNITADEAKAEMASGGAMKMRPGQYEMKISFTDVQMSGIPEMARGMMQSQMAKGMTVKSCMTQEQIDDPGADMFGQEKDDSCKIEKFDRSGNSMEVAMTCNQAEGMQSSSKMSGTFGSDSYSMDVEQEMSGMPGMTDGKMSMKGKIEAKRIGDCPS